MVYFEFVDNSLFERKWTTAVSIRPTSHVIQWTCPGCGRADNRPTGSFDVTLEGGSLFPDVLGCGAYPLLIVSDRVVAAWNNAGVGSFLQSPVGIAAIQDSRAQIIAAPNYYHIEITGECVVDLKASGIAITSTCNRCGEIERKPPTIRPLKILDGSWDGSDLFRDRRFFPRVSFCTTNVVDLFRSHDFTNASFEKME